MTASLLLTGFMIKFLVFKTKFCSQQKYWNLHLQILGGVAVPDLPVVDGRRHAHWRNAYISYSHVVSCSAGGRPAYYFVRVNRHETVTYDAKNGGIG